MKMRPRPRVEGKQNPGVADKGGSSVGNAARTVPMKLRAGTRSAAASQLMKKGY